MSDEQRMLLHVEPAGLLGVRLWMMIGWVVSTENWLPCEHPERPFDALTVYHIGGACYGCRVAVAALLKRWPDDPHAKWLLNAVNVFLPNDIDPRGWPAWFEVPDYMLGEDERN